MDDGPVILVLDSREVSRATPQPLLALPWPSVRNIRGALSLIPRLRPHDGSRSDEKPSPAGGWLVGRPWDKEEDAGNVVFPLYLPAAILFVQRPAGAGRASQCTNGANAMPRLPWIDFDVHGKEGRQSAGYHHDPGVAYGANVCGIIHQIVNEAPWGALGQMKSPLDLSFGAGAYLFQVRRALLVAALLLAICRCLTLAQIPAACSAPPALAVGW
ncbi:hypothetical protein CPLU01_03226 [Colletotrichum plurivorum]|uniref:Uncharacterized protein n=1 Tax=Colletotrichum plurivorum TaxID=2175906 RepID=A0A8H6KSY5_9PEZI|nr:hypothetical protein CPLU01_03226 [Colletotrichum plurivorum]